MRELSTAMPLVGPVGKSVTTQATAGYLRHSSTSDRRGFFLSFWDFLPLMMFNFSDLLLFGICICNVNIANVLPNK